MGKLLLIAVGALMLILPTTLFSVQKGNSDSEKRFNEHAGKVLALEVALTGMGDVEKAIVDGYASGGSYTGQTSWTADYAGGTYDVSLNPTGSSVSVTVVGRIYESRHTIKRTYSWQDGESGGVPEFMSRPITCDGNFVTKDDFTLSNPSENTDVHTNGNLRFESGDALITGFGAYNGNLELLNGQSESAIFQPTSNPGGAPLTQQVAEIEVPVFTASDHLGSATATHFSDLELSGNVTMGTEESPAVWYVEGNVKITGPVTFSGFGVIVATGNFEIEYNVSTVGGSGQSSVGFYTEGNITVKNGGLSMAGQWFLNGNVEVEDNTTFSGSITSSGNCYFDKSFNMAYVEASSALTGPIWPESGGEESTGSLILSSAQEW